MKNPTCSIKGCSRPVLARGWCGKHYQRWLYKGDPKKLAKVGRPRLPKRRCAIDGCTKFAIARGWCFAHYMRWARHGNTDVLLRVPNGTWSKYLERALNHREDTCFIWPHGKRRPKYRPKITLSGRQFSISRIVCEAVNGPPASPDLEAAHSCKNGNVGCVSPLHLRWATRKENEADKGAHWRRRSNS